MKAAKTIVIITLLCLFTKSFSQINLQDSDFESDGRSNISTIQVNGSYKNNYDGDNGWGVIDLNRTFNPAYNAYLNFGHGKGALCADANGTNVDNFNLPGYDENLNTIIWFDPIYLPNYVNTNSDYIIYLSMDLYFDKGSNDDFKIYVHNYDLNQTNELNSFSGESYNSNYSNRFDKSIGGSQNIAIGLFFESNWKDSNEEGIFIDNVLLDIINGELWSPSITSISDDRKDGILLNWNTSPGADVYHIQRLREDESSWTQIATSSGTSYLDETAVENYIYYYRLRAYDNYLGTSEYTACCQSGFREVSPPSTPSINSVSQNQNGYVNVIANNQSDAHQIKFYKATTNSFSSASALTDWLDISSSANRTFTDTNVTPGQIYYYWIRATKFNDVNYQSAQSSSNSGYAQMDIPSDFVTRTDDVKYPGEVKLDWSVVLNAAYYKIYRTSQNSNSGFTYHDQTSLNYYYDTDYTSSSVYHYYKVLAVSPDGIESAMSTPKIESPAKVENPIFSLASNNYVDKIVLDWNSIGSDRHGNSFKYKLYRSESSNVLSKVFIANREANQHDYTDLDVTPDKTYYYWVQALHPTKSSYDSEFDEISGKTLATPALEVDVSSLSTFSSTGGTSSSISITSNVGWAIQSSQNWITLSKSSGSNNDSFTITTDAHSSTSSRNAEVTVTGGGITRTINVIQSGASETSTLTVDPTSLSTFSSTGGTSSTISITSNVGWLIQSSQTWITLSKSSGSNNDSFTITTDAQIGRAHV
ncbi:MAG: BACON domain-containing carbohydrate-binding protein, partial [Marinoscillum sp.]